MLATKLTGLQKRASNLLKPWPPCSQEEPTQRGQSYFLFVRGGDRHPSLPVKERQMGREDGQPPDSEGTETAGGHPSSVCPSTPAHGVRRTSPSAEKTPRVQGRSAHGDQRPPPPPWVDSSGDGMPARRIFLHKGAARTPAAVIFEASSREATAPHHPRDAGG